MKYWLIILSIALLFAVNAFSQERKHALAIYYGPSGSRIWTSPYPAVGKQRSIFANTAFLEYKVALWSPKIKFHIGVNYMERGLKLIQDVGDNNLSIAKEKFTFFGAKTSASFNIKKYNIECGLLIHKTLSWAIERDGKLIERTDVATRPTITNSPFIAFGRDFELRPRIDFCTKAFFTNSVAFNRWNYGVSVGLDYQFGKEIVSKKKGG